MITEVAVINVTDIDTLGVLLSRLGRPVNTLDPGWNFWAYTYPDNIRQLNLTFRLPVAFYRKLEDESMDSLIGQQIRAESTDSISWVSLWPAIFKLQQLRSLHIWLDHDGKSSWSVVNERMALRHFSAALAAHKQIRTQENGLPHIDVVLSLPNLNPGRARPDSHFTEDHRFDPDDSTSPFTIYRRIRQRWHCEEQDSGELSVEYSPDFPFLEMLREIEPVFENRLQSVEEYEMRLWDQGVDVEAMWEQEITDMSESIVCWGTMDGSY
ncbi:hypothetical protein F5Y07DRAFT_398089 [Xylaria sp. FL0933]|nr:hypothetical protein F5Y07DRAFT_398089 [Xylaria sp. FL0933]